MTGIVSAGAIRSDLVVRFDERNEQLVFFLQRKADTDAKASSRAAFSVTIPLEDLRERGADGAEMLVGESVLGFFDNLTAGRMNLPRHYRDSASDDES